MYETTCAGDWRIVVQSRDASWAQRVVVNNAYGGQQVLTGTAGYHLDVQGDGTAPWQVRIEHNDGSGWAASDLKVGPRQVAGSSITQVVRSEDNPAGGDADYNDLIIRLEKLGMVDQPSLPFAVWPVTMQVMPEGIFEASLGRYFMAVTVRNVWTETWPAAAAVGLTNRCRSWLQNGGVIVQDSWSDNEQAAVGQQVTNGRVHVGALEPWETRVIYFKVDVSSAKVRKHQVEVEVMEPAAEDLDHLNRKARAPMSVSRTTYDAAKKAFVATCDRGVMTASVKEITVDYHSFKRAVGRARELFQSGAGTSPGGSGGTASGCPKAMKERLRQRLRAFLEGKDEDICGIWRDLQCCCAGGRWGDDGGGDWTGSPNGRVSFFAFPTVVDYRIDYVPSFTGQYGPIPFDDPWWKILLLIIAIILTIAAAVSGAADLANRSDDVVIGQVERSILNAHAADDIPVDYPPLSAGSVDAAVVKLNGHRGFTTAVFSFKDAASDEENTTPINTLGGIIDTAGLTLSNADIEGLFQNLADNPGDPAAAAALQLFKSGARSGTTVAVLDGLQRSMPRGPEEDGSTVYFANQLRIIADPAAPTKISRGGDSGSLWVQRNAPYAIVGLNHAGDDTDMTAYACRIEDVINALNIRFA